MPVFTVQQLVDRAAAISDMHDDFVTPQQWLAWYNTERQAFSLAMARNGAALQDIQISVTPATAQFSISGPVLAIVGVWEQYPDERLRPLKILNFADNFRSGLNTGPAQYVVITEDSTVTTNSTDFRFFPTPTSGNYMIVTLRAPDVATTLADTTSIALGLEERIVLGMARRALIKEESDVTDISKLIIDQDQLIEEFGWKRTFAQMPGVRNVDALQRGWVTDVMQIDPNAWYWM